MRLIVALFAIVGLLGFAGFTSGRRSQDRPQPRRTRASLRKSPRPPMKAEHLLQGRRQGHRPGLVSGNR